MSNAIARGSVILTADADQMASGLNKAEKKVQSFGKKINSDGGGLMGGMAGGVALGGPWGAAIAGGIHLAGKLSDKFGEMTESIDQASKTSRALGTDMATWQGLSHAADLSGVSVESLTTGLGKFRRTVEGPLDEALYQFADRLEAVEDPGKRAQMLVENFGKSGLGLAAMFEGGKEGLQQMVGEAEKLGIAMSDADGKKIEEANDAITRLKTSGKGLFTTILVAIAPAIQRVSEFVTKIVTFLRPAFEWYGRYLGQVWEIADWVFSAMGDAISDVADWIGEATDGWFDFVGPLPTIQEVVVGVFRVIGTAAAFVWDGMKAGAGGIAIVLGYLVEQFAEVAKSFKEMRSSILLGMADAADAIGSTETAAGLRASVDRVEAAYERIGAAGEGMQAWGQGAIENFGKSADQFNGWLDNKLKKEKEAVKVKGGPLELEAAPAIAKWAGAMEQGSKEAYSLNLRSMYGDRGNGDDAATKAIKANGQKQDDGNRKLGAIEKRLADIESF